MGMRTVALGASHARASTSEPLGTGSNPNRSADQFRWLGEMAMPADTTGDRPAVIRGCGLTVLRAKCTLALPKIHRTEDGEEGLSERIDTGSQRGIGAGGSRAAGVVRTGILDSTRQGTRT
jgi:hypothetical protein